MYTAVYSCSEAVLVVLVASYSIAQDPGKCRRPGHRAEARGPGQVRGPRERREPSDGGQPLVLARRAHGDRRSGGL